MLRQAVHPGLVLKDELAEFGVDPQFWLNLQGQFDLATADRQVGAIVKELPTAAGSA